MSSDDHFQVKDVGRNERWLNNFHQNFHRFTEIKDVMMDRLSAPKPAIVSAAGWSLHDAAPIIKDWPGAVFSGVSECGWWQEHGRLPDYIMSVDGNPSQVDKLKELRVHDKTTLISHPCVDPGMLTGWRGRKLRWFPIDDSVIGRLPDLYTQDPGHLAIFGGGCTAVIAISVAIILGYRPIYLCGVDMAQVDGHRRWTDAHEHHDSAHYQSLFLKGTTLDEKGEPLKEFMLETGFTSLVYRNELRVAMIDPQSALYQAPIVSCSRGILDWLPYWQPERALEQELNPTQPSQQRGDGDGS